MRNEIITLGIHSKDKATLLVDLLEKNGITVFVEKSKIQNILNSTEPETEQYYLKIPISMLEKAIGVVGYSNSSDYSNSLIKSIDDGKMRFLVATDFSEDSLKACELAFSFAKKFNAKIKIIHIFRKMFYPSHFPFADKLTVNIDSESLYANAIGRMKSFCKIIDEKIKTKEWPTINYSYALKEGVIESEISDFCDIYNPALLFMGTQGEHYTSKNVIGSVTADVFEIVDKPVLSIPRNSKIKSYSDIKHVLYMISLREWDKDSFDILQKINDRFYDAKFTLLHVSQNKEKESESKQMLNQIAEELKKKNNQCIIDTEVIVSDDAISEIDAYAHSEQNKISLICINTRKRNLFGRIFVPSFSRKVLSTSNTPILVLKS